jgi:hypothetical protein
MSNTSLSDITTELFKYKISIFSINDYKNEKINKDRVNELIHNKEFINWIQCKSLEIGTGQQYEYYTVSNNWKDDLGVKFYVSLEKNM